MKTLLFILKLVLCIFISYSLFFYITSNVISYFYQGSFYFEQILYILIFLSQTLFICRLCIPTHFITVSFERKLIYCLYACIMLILLFGRGYISESISLDISQLFSVSAFFPNLFNFLFFIPAGLPIKKENRFILVLMKTILFVCAIEFLQLITHRGIFDINDIILNTCGIICGYFLSFKFPDKYKPDLF